jgi:hypothetical protein
MSVEVEVVFEVPVQAELATESGSVPQRDGVRDKLLFLTCSSTQRPVLQEALPLLVREYLFLGWMDV